MQVIDQVFLASAIVGAGVLVLSALMGAVGHVGHQGAHTGHDVGDAGHSAGAHHVDHGGHHDGGHGQATDAEWAAFGRTVLSFLSPISLAMSLTYFGLLGFILSTASLGTGLSVTVAIVFGFAAARLTTTAVSRIMATGEQSSHASVRDFLGRVGEVTVSIPERGVGQIALTSGGSRLTYAAKADGPISVGSRVMVEAIDSGVATVSRYSD